MKVMIPPIKCQGIKGKIFPLIKRSLDWSFEGTWIEPFMGSGIVGFNIMPRRAIFADSNPYLIDFYKAVASGKIDGFAVRRFLEHEGEILARCGKDYYYEVRARFNETSEPMDFLFLNRCCFNGMIRFNRKGEFNTPFGHKPQRFSKAYITKVANQVDYVSVISKNSDWSFICQDFRETLKEVSEDDFIYCDPPYVGRHTDYFDSWDEESEKQLFAILSRVPCKFLLSTWHSNQYRKNLFLDTLWSKFNVVTKEHFYHLGARMENRNPMLEALVMNFTPRQPHEEPANRPEQLKILEGLMTCQKRKSSETQNQRLFRQM